MDLVAVDSGRHPTKRVAPGGVGGFAGQLLLLTLLGVAVQLWFVLDNYDRNVYDGVKYSNDANLLSQGHGFISSEASYFHGIWRQSAIHPPLTSMWLSMGSLAGLRELGLHQLWMLLPGAGVVASIGMLGRAVAGRRVGLIAAGLAALHPGVWTFPATVMAETPAQLFVVLSLLAAYAWRERPTPLRMGLLAAAAAFASLARSEYLLFMVLLVAGLVITTPGLAVQTRVRNVLAAAVWAGTLLGPWVAFNYVRFDPPALYATGFDVTFASSNCSAAYYGRAMGYWAAPCRPRVELANSDGSPKDEAAISQEYRRVAIDYIRSDQDRLPAVVRARLARTFSVGDLDTKAKFEGINEGRGKPAVYASAVAFYVSLPLSIIGVVLLRRRRQVLWPLIVPALCAAAATSIITHGTTRYRVGIDVGLIVLSAVAIEALWRRLRTGRCGPEDSASNAAAGATSEDGVLAAAR